MEKVQQGSCGHFQSEAGAAAWRQERRHGMRMSAGEQDNYGSYRYERQSQKRSKGKFSDGEENGDGLVNYLKARF